MMKRQLLTMTRTTTRTAKTRIALVAVAVVVLVLLQISFFKSANEQIIIITTNSYKDNGGNISAKENIMTHFHQEQKIIPTSQHQHHLPKQDYNNFNSSVKLIFIIGLEGTGHHYLAELLSKSPHVKEAIKLGIYPDLISQLRMILFMVREPKRGIWSSFCAKTDLQNATRKFTNLVQQIKQINHLQNYNNNNTQISIPINTVPAGEGIGFGMMSYPNFGGPCRDLNYPNLQLLYKACTHAKIDCEHIYIHRSPVQIIMSTSVKRKFNPTILRALHLYISYYYIIQAQLALLPTKPKGCFGFYDTDNPMNKNLLPTLGTMFGWNDKMNNAKRFYNVSKRLYKKPSPILSDEWSELIPNRYYIHHLETISRLHNVVLQNNCLNLKGDKETMSLSTQQKLLPSFQKETTITTTKANFYNDNDNSSVEFVIFLGILRIGEIGLVPFLSHVDTLHEDNNTKQLKNLLYNSDDPHEGLWSAAPCSMTVETNITKIFEDVVRQLVQIKTQHTPTNKIIIPLSFPPASGSQNTIESRCMLQYPNLDLFYAACDQARVGCKHIYVHQQNPYQILSGLPTIGKTIGYGIHWATTHFYILYGQLRSHPHRLMSCVNINAKDSSGHLFATMSLHGVELHDQSMYSNPYHLTIDTDSDQESDIDYALLAEAMVQAHKQILSLCPDYPAESNNDNKK